eukprot:TRINITY_DN11740_c0_g1_i1.p1 TRINITY_DN11740_c0_g1~~TRINITY_DN11740_c0_g1_i1.p1  ORF type:complete len:172 (+),score=16.12 TRINITY_DN11740_c0_g1_i1:142-657(+)
MFDIYIILPLFVDKFSRISNTLESISRSRILCIITNETEQLIEFDNSDTNIIEPAVIDDDWIHTENLELSISDYENILKNKNGLIKDLYSSLLDYMIMSIKLSMYKEGTSIKVDKDTIKEHIINLNISHTEWPNAIAEYILSKEVLESDSNCNKFNMDSNYVQKDNNCVVM